MKMENKNNRQAKNFFWGALLGAAAGFVLGLLYALVPAGTGALIMLVVALLVNNIPRTRRYPEFWL